MKADFFEVLSNVDVKDRIKQKNGLNYLSWMWAWHELKKRFPLSYATVHETEDGMLVWKDPNGAHVKTTVTVVWEDDNGEVQEHSATEYLPIMDFKNKPVPYDSIDSMQVNKTIQRSLTKCIARLGLGDYIYVNEDLPVDIKDIAKLQTECMELIKKKCGLSDRAKDKVSEICKAADENANGDPRLIEDVDVLAELKKQLLAVRK